MPQTPDDLSRIIMEMARRHAERIGKPLGVDAEVRIGTIPPEYRSRPQIAVEMGPLDSMIGEIIVLAGSFSKEQIGLSELEMALGRVTCHYLWFC
jgi:hypothetical protein